MKLLHILLIIVTISIMSTLWFFPTAVQNALSKKPDLYLLPDHIQSPHVISTFPKHNQFLASTPTVVKVQLDAKPTDYTAEVTFDEKQVNTNASLDETNNSLIIPLSSFVQNGIYQIKYSVCFGKDDCSDGQYAYKVDSSKITEFSNFSKLDKNNNIVSVKVTDKGLDPKNILIDIGTIVRWEYEGSEQLAIDGSTFRTSVQAEENADVLSASSSAQSFTQPGEYTYTIQGNPSLTGRILVQKNQ